MNDDDMDDGAEAGHGQPGYPVDGHAGWRAGVTGPGGGLLGLKKAPDTAAAMPSAYMSDGHGGVRLRRDFAASHPKGPFDFGGMAKEIDWPGVALDLGKIGAGVAASLAAPFAPALLGWGAAPAEAVGAAGSGALPNPWVTGATFAWRGGRTLHKQNKANPPNAQPVVKPGVDRASNGLP